MSKADQKSSHKLVGSLIQFLMDLGTNMAGFWRGLGGQVGAMLGPNATKAGPNYTCAWTPNKIWDVHLKALAAGLRYP